jgi:signal transduction histidine kinase
MDPFFTTKDTGTGLGLAIVKNILESHRATMTLGDSPGGGARVDLAIPRKIGALDSE